MNNGPHYRVFAYGSGHAALISERLDKDAAEARRSAWQRSMPNADMRVEKVNAQGWPICDIVVSVRCPHCGPVVLGAEAWSYKDGESVVTEYRATCKCKQKLYGFAPQN
jgi:hypothetical protein